MTNIQEALRQAQTEINSDTAGLDAQLLLCKVLRKARSFCFTYPETLLSNDQITRFNQLVEQRKQGVPIAYLLNEKEFWSRDFIVTKDCLIPRPETELIIEWCLHNLPKDQVITVLDLGTGSGAIAVTLAAERPSWHISASDICEKALFVAKQNAIKHSVTQIRFYKSNWFAALGEQQYDVIIANPPYVAEYDAKLHHEPALALYSKQSGLHDVQTVVEQAPKFLKRGGRLILEHGHDQQNAVIGFLEKSSYCSILSFDDSAGLNRMVVAQYAKNSSREQ